MAKARAKSQPNRANRNRRASPRHRPRARDKDKDKVKGRVRARDKDRVKANQKAIKSLTTRIKITRTRRNPARTLSPLKINLRQKLLKRKTSSARKRRRWPIDSSVSGTRISVSGIMWA